MAAKKKVETKTEFSDAQIKHLEIIQDALKRMAANSFQIKGWMLTIVSALLGFYANTGNTKFALVAVLPVLVFWGLDSYFLQQERKIRGVYNDVVNPDKAQIKVGLFEMPLQNYSEGKYSFWSVFTSQTMVILYFSIALILVAINFFM